MRRLLALSLTAGAVLALVACGGQSSTASTAGPAPSAAATGTTSTAATSSTTPAATTSQTPTTQPPAGASTGPGSCSAKGITAISKIQGVCTLSSGVTFDFANRGTALQLPQLAAKLDAVNLTTSLPEGKRRLIAKGEYVVVTLTVTNKTSQPQAFDGRHSQVLLLTATSGYPEDLQAEKEPGSFASEVKHPIPPGASLEAAIVFQVSSAEAADAKKEGLVTVLQYSDAATTTNQKPKSLVGALRLS